jgi:hypothetical protein
MPLRNMPSLPQSNRGNDMLRRFRLALKLRVRPAIAENDIAWVAVVAAKVGVGSLLSM